MTDKKPNDDEYEYEESYVYVDFDSKLLDEELLNADTKIRFLGINTKQPIMQLNNQLFRGFYDYAVGTNCFFSESKRSNGGSRDACFYELPSKSYDYHCKSNKILKMSRIFVEEDVANNRDNADNLASIDLEQLKISKTYTEALNQFLEPNQKPPRAISEIFRKKRQKPQQEGTEESHQTEEAAQQEESQQSEEAQQKESQQVETEESHQHEESKQSEESEQIGESQESKESHQTEELQVDPQQEPEPMDET